MNCSQSGTIECDTVQIIEPRGDFLIDTAGTTSDLDERGVVDLNVGQTAAIVYFVVPKLNANYNFEYLYVSATDPPQSHPGTIIPIPTIRDATLFGVRLAGVPDVPGYKLHWRVTIVRTSSIVQIDAPEVHYLRMPRVSTMNVIFTNPRSSLNYGFTELRVENLSQEPSQAIIHVQVIVKTINGVALGVNPVPRTDNYFLRCRTP